MKIITRNSTYEIKGNTLLRNGEVYTDKILFHNSNPAIGGRLYVEYEDSNGCRYYMNTSAIQDVIAD